VPEPRAAAYELDRRAVVAAVLAERGDGLVVAGLGAPGYDCYAAADHDLTFYLWGAMGSAAPVGLGLALAQPKRRVLVVTGDGELMMGLGGLATIAAQAPANLAILVLDNEAFAETGQQTGLTAGKADLAALALAAGFPHAMTARRAADMPTLLDFAWRQPGPALAVAKVALRADPMALPPRDGALLRARFRRALLGPAADYE
jgi:thiamine pyrophosphate-dependent acetolactate synthase large subunit-like protein